MAVSQAHNHLGSLSTENLLEMLLIADVKKHW